MNYFNFFLFSPCGIWIFVGMYVEIYLGPDWVFCEESFNKLKNIYQKKIKIRL